jgi:hypothetical protein
MHRVTQLTSFYYLLLVNASLPAKSVKELLALGKNKPDSLNYGLQEWARGTSRRRALQPRMPITPSSRSIPRRVVIRVSEFGQHGLGDRGFV